MPQPGTAPYEGKSLRLNTAAWRSRIGSTTAYSSFGNTAFVLVSALVGLLVARILGPADRGLLAVAFTYFSVVVAIGEVTTNQAVTYFLARHPRSHGSIYRRISALSLGIGSISAIAFISLGILLVDIESPYGYLFVAYGIMIPLATQVTIPLFAVLAVDSRQWTRLRLLQPLGYAVALLVAIAVGSLSLATVAASYAFGLAVQFGWSTWTWRQIRRRIDSDQTLDREDSEHAHPDDIGWGAIFGYAINGGLGGLPRIASTMAPMLLLPLWLSPSEIGMYAVSMSLTALIAPAAVAVGLVALPLIARSSARADWSATRALIHTALKRTRWVVLATATATALAAPIAVALLLGPEFRGAGLLAAALCVPAAFLTLSTACYSILRGLGEGRRSAIPEWIGACVIVVLMPLLLPMLGLAGVVVAATLASIFTYVAYRRMLRLALDNLIDSTKRAP